MAGREAVVFSRYKGRIKLGVKERLCNGNDGEAAVYRGRQISIAKDLQKQIRSSFGRNDTL